MKWTALWYQKAVEDLQQLTVRNTRQATRLSLAVREYAQTGRGDTKKLQGSDEWRLRTGDWRIFLRFVGWEVHVTGFSDRQDAY